MNQRKKDLILYLFGGIGVITLYMLYKMGFPNYQFFVLMSFNLIGALYIALSIGRLKNSGHTINRMMILAFLVAIASTQLNNGISGFIISAIVLRIMVSLFDVAVQIHKKNFSN